MEQNNRHLWYPITVKILTEEILDGTILVGTYGTFFPKIACL
jgi:hypothetical protein